MLEKFLRFSRRLLISSLIFLLGMSFTFGLMLASTHKASASGKESLEKEPAKTIKAEKLAIKEVSGLQPNGYFPGERINLSFDMSAAESAWAEVGMLDPSFPNSVNLYHGVNGLWQLKTPFLTNNLNSGGYAINIWAKAYDGTTASQKVKVVLKPLLKIDNLSVKAGVENNIVLNWQAQSGAEQYLIEWRAQSKSFTSKSKKISAKFLTTEINQLQTGTFYEIEVTPLLFGGQKGIGQKITFKTSGVAPELEPVIETPETESIVAPAIDTGISTVSLSTPTTTTPKTAGTVSQAAPEPQKEIEPSPAPSAEEEPQEDEEQAKAGGWNKLLVALSILIIAAGAAIGGYYGYEWLMLKSKDDNDPPKPKSNSRW